MIKNSAKKYVKFSNWERIGIGLLIVGGIFSPLAFTQFSFGISFLETGQIGDTIGGLTAPFLNLLAAFLVYKSFTAQIQANIDQRNAHQTEMNTIMREQSINYVNQVVNIMFEDFKESQGFSNTHKGWVHELNARLRTHEQSLRRYEDSMKTGTKLKNPKPDFNNQAQICLRKLTTAKNNIRGIYMAIQNFEKKETTMEESILVTYYYKKLYNLLEEMGYHRLNRENYKKLLEPDYLESYRSTSFLAFFIEYEAMYNVIEAKAKFPYPSFPYQ